MQKNIIRVLAVLFLIPALLFTVSCAKKEVVTTPVDNTTAVDDSIDQAAAQQAIAEQELAEQLAAQELAEAAMAAKRAFLEEKVYFEFDSSALTPEAEMIIKAKASWLLENAGNVTISGHCDERGTEAYNLALGDRRAQSVKTFLLDLGIVDSRLKTISFGEERPAVTGNTEVAWQMNRRVEFSLD
ncbi:MAG: OmpA family protein [Desulfobacterales bacterium]|nr:OmpA family protein [Desulfobacterales bacterium]